MSLNPIVILANSILSFKSLRTMRTLDAGRESSKEEGNRAMQLRVYETEIGSLGPAKMTVNMCLGRVQRLEV